MAGPVMTHGLPEFRRPANARGGERP
jgi:hypothetical protein